jgi:hypothetical protein
LPFSFYFFFPVAGAACRCSSSSACLHLSCRNFGPVTLQGFISICYCTKQSSELYVKCHLAEVVIYEHMTQLLMRDIHSSIFFLLSEQHGCVLQVQPVCS